MTDEKKPPEGAEPFDWDGALAEWEDKDFSPEVAKEPPVAPAKHEPPAPPPRPFYRPPTDLMAKAPARPPAVTSEPPTARAPEPADDDDEDGATRMMVAPDPFRLAPPPPAIPRPVSRSPIPPARTLSPSPSPGSRSATPTLAPPPDSARPAAPDVSGDGNDAAELPPFRSQQATIPATDEIDALTRAAVGSVSPATPAQPQGEIPAPPSVDVLVEPGVDVELPRAPRVQRKGEARSWSDDRPASAWLDEPARAALLARAMWLEDEARTTVDKVIRARALLACSEMFAIAGELAHAEELATEARTIAPSVALAHRQARALLPSPADPDDYLVLLDIEAKAAPGPAARAHSTLLAADLLRARGDDEGAAKRLEQAARLVPGDARPAVARAVRALGKQDLRRR